MIRKCLLLSIVLLLGAGAARAHTLGIDPATLTELADARYQLVVKIPPNLAALITTVSLPARCRLDGNPQGDRGAFDIRFAFDCATPLVAADEILLPWAREGVMLTVNWIDAEPITRFAASSGQNIHVDLAEFLASSGSISQVAGRYTLLGIEHILDGIDHLLFVLALLFVVHSGWKLVQTITAFTAAHSLTLALATLGYVNLPSAPVEAAIALSIVFLCSEILRARRGLTGLTFAWPWTVAFSFGLLHGFGFAGALAEIGLPPAEVPLALLFFNVGVEIGQLVFVFAFLLLLTILRYATNITRTSSAFLHTEKALVYSGGITASYWLIERTVQIFPLGL